MKAFVINSMPFIDLMIFHCGPHKTIFYFSLHLYIFISKVTVSSDQVTNMGYQCSSYTGQQQPKDGLLKILLLVEMLKTLGTLVESVIHSIVCSTTLTSWFCLLLCRLLLAVVIYNLLVIHGAMRHACRPYNSQRKCTQQ